MAEACRRSAADISPAAPGARRLEEAMSTAPAPPGIRVPGRSTPDGTTPLSDPLLHSDTRKRICGWCQESEAKLECASCARVYCVECSRSAHKQAKNSNHRVTFIDRPAGITTPSRASLRDRETLDDILTNIGSAIKPEVARLDERTYGTPEHSINVSRADVRPSAVPGSLHEDEVQAPASHGSITESLLGLDERAAHRKYVRRVVITIGVMVLLYLALVARTCYLYGGVVLGADVPVTVYNLNESALTSLGYTGLKHGVFVALGLLYFLLSCNFSIAFPRSLFNVYSLVAGAFMVVATVTAWWMYTQMADQEVEENVEEIFYAFSIIFIPWVSVFFRPERCSIRTAVICLNLAVGGMLAFYSIYSSLAIPPFPTTMMIICSVFVFPPLFLSFLRLSAFTVGVTKSLFGIGVAVSVVLVPLSIVAEREVWRAVFDAGRAAVLKLLGALAIDVLVLTLTTTLACLLQMADFGYYVYAAVLFSDRRILLSILQGSYGWNVYHVVGICLMLLSLIVWAFDLKTYLDKKNKFL